MSQTTAHQESMPTFACDTARAGDGFVGLRFEEKEKRLKIYFPMGFNLAKENDEDYHKKRRKDVLKLISVLSSFGNEKKEQGFYYKEANAVKDENVFPIHSYLYVVSEFLTHGYYTEVDDVYRKSDSGKINWARTIKHIKPLVSENGLFYSEFITKKTNHNENELITKIHKWCVYESFLKIGFLFCSFLPQKPALTFNASFFRTIILAKIAETFNEKTLMLLHHILNIVEYRDKNKDSTIDCFGTCHFHVVWEKMIDSIFGIADKTEFQPQGTWFIDGEPHSNSVLLPDTVMKVSPEDGRVFILDSKYYPYGLNQKNADGLPATSDMLKQVAYAEHVEEELGCNASQIFNAFLMPYESKECVSGGAVPCKYSGHAKLIWKNERSSKPYQEIRGILLDTRWVMENCSTHNDDAIEKLAEMIENKG